MNERQVRIEVGYGLEGRIPDGKAGESLMNCDSLLEENQPNQAVINTYETLVNEVAAEYGVKIEGQQENGQSSNY